LSTASPPLKSGHLLQISRTRRFTTSPPPTISRRLAGLSSFNHRLKGSSSPPPLPSAPPSICSMKCKHGHQHLPAIRW
jgi:hypothetical protein